MNEKKKDVKKKRREKKRRIKAHPPHPPHPPPDQLRNYEAGHTYGGLKRALNLVSMYICNFDTIQFPKRDFLFPRNVDLVY